MCGGAGKVGMGTHLLLLLVEVVDDDTDEEVEGEEGSEDDEDDKIKVHIEVHLILWLLLLLQGTQEGWGVLGGLGGTRWLLYAPHPTAGRRVQGSEEDLSTPRVSEAPEQVVRGWRWGWAECAAVSLV